MRKRALHLELNSAAVWLGVCQAGQNKGSNHLPNILPKLFPRVTFGHDCLCQTLSAIAAVGFLDHFEDEFSHAPKSKLPMAERQVPALKKQITRSGC
jgi:hypothetical protein